MFATFAGFGLGMTATKYVPNSGERAEKAGRVMGLSAVVAWASSAVCAMLMYLARLAGCSHLECTRVNSRVARQRCLPLF